MTAYIYPDPIVLPPIVGTSPAVGDAPEPIPDFIGLVATLRVTTVAQLAALPVALGKIVELVDEQRNGLWVWDPTVPAAWHQADVNQYAFIAPSPTSDGAWTSYYADTRLGYWSDSVPPARFGRYKSGIRIGDAVLAKGAIGESDTWLGTVGGNPNDWRYMESARALVLNTGPGIAGVFAARSTQQSNANALYAVAYLRSTDPIRGAWALYAEGVAGVGTKGVARAGEFNGVNLRGSPEDRANPAQRIGETPHMSNASRPTDLTFVLALSAGGDPTVHGNSDPLDSYLRFNWLGAIDDGQQAGAMCAMMIRHNALVRETYPWGFGPVIRMARGHGLQWFGNDDELETFRLYCDVSGAAAAQRLGVSNDGLRYQRGDTGTLLFVPFVEAAVNYLRISAAATGVAPEIAAVGQNTDVDLRFTTKGAGLIMFPNNAATSGGPTTPTAWLNVKLPSGQVFRIHGTVI